MPSTDHTRRTVELYRGFKLIHECMGHTNVESDHRFYGGYRTAADARRCVDRVIQQANTTVERVEMADGRVAYRVNTPALGL